MKAVNSVSLIGRLTADVEEKKTNNGKSVARFKIAVNRDKETADFPVVNAWNQSADFLARYAKKGDLISVSGQIRTGSYDSNGQKVYFTEILADDVTILSHAQRNQQNNGGNPYPAQNQRQTGYNEPSQSDYGNPIEISSEDLPF